jgi:hypothetical protein
MSQSNPGSTPERAPAGVMRPVKLWMYHRLGIDRAIAFTVLGRGWASFAGLVTLALIAHFLTPVQQGYYYVFGSLVALQVVFELGFSFVILQLASHERAHLTITPEGEVQGNALAHARLASVLQKATRWYSAAAILVALFLLTAGTYFFSSHNASSVAWRAPWYTTAIAASITFQLDPILSFMEGCGFVANVARLRFFQAITGNTMAWITLSLHHGLFAPSMVIFGNALCASIWLFMNRRFLMGLLRFDSSAHKIRWMKEVWPFQWRIAVSWLCGIFIYQLYNPVLFAYQGPIAAGQMGMSLNIANALQSVAVSWFNTKAAPFGAMIARGDFEKLDEVFFRSVRQAIGVFLFAACSIWAVIAILHWKQIPFANRVLNPVSLAFLFGATAFNVLGFAEALYLRAHKQEKFLVPSIVGAIFTAFSTYFLGRYYGTFGVVCGSLSLAIFLGLPMNTYVFLKYRRLWHTR